MKNKSKTSSPGRILLREGVGLGAILGRAACEIGALRPRKGPKTVPKEPKPNRSPFEISAVVCTRGQRSKLINAVNSLKNQTLSRDLYEIVVVCSGVSPSDEILRQIQDVRLVSVPEPGLSRARNAGAEGGGEIITYIDDDAIAAPDLLEKVRDSFSAHKRAGIIGGQILLKRPLPDIVLEGHEDLWSEYKIPGKRYREVKFQYEFPFGANFSVRREVLETAGGFDESYGRVGDNYAGGEEAVLCFAVRSLGFKIGLEPECMVLHDVDEDRFTREHIRHTVEAGIMTTRKLYEDGLSPSAWDISYTRRRIKIAEDELKRLRRDGGEELNIFYKECERDAFVKLARKIEKTEQTIR